ncbi:MAG: SUMF1/EgtB/PvdO family nonheme iron enzyme [Acidobacteria bacterium]|nr:SUMF1/EgtB/PvdO family nonheme iron enzyme [Acidobacteriota bacterium]
MKGWSLLVVLLLSACLYGQDELPARGDLNGDTVTDAVDTVILANYQVGHLATLYSAGDICGLDRIVGVLRFVPAGTFTQGRGTGDPCTEPDETAFTHELTSDLAVMATEVTRKMWAELKAAQPTLPDDLTPSSEDVTNPVMLYWTRALLFANLLNIETGRTRCYYTDAAFTVPIDASNYSTGPFYCDWTADGYRLPTEGEWEYFCRAGTTSAFSVAEPMFTHCSPFCTAGVLVDLESVAWFCANLNDPLGNNTPKPAAMKDPNPWGLHDVHGNMWEMCWDIYDTYPTGTVTNYRGASSGTLRVIRGGGYDSNADACRSAERGGIQPNFGSANLGFRLCRLAD